MGQCNGGGIFFFDEESHMGSLSSSQGEKVGSVSWVYHTKYAADGSIDRYKECLIAKGFSKVEGIDYSETFSPITKMNSMCIVLSLAASQG